MELELIPAQTGNGTMKMYTNPKPFLSVDSWPPKSKDMQLLILRSCMSFLSGGQLSTDKLVLQFVYIFIVSFPVWAGIKIIQAKTGNGITINSSQFVQSQMM